MPSVNERFLHMYIICLLTENLHFVCLFDLILYVIRTNSQLCRDGSFRVEPVLSLGLMCLAQGHNALTPVMHYLLP